MPVNSLKDAASALEHIAQEIDVPHRDHYKRAAETLEKAEKRIFALERVVAVLAAKAGISFAEIPPDQSQHVLSDPEVKALVQQR
jgi:hypothetical protein